MTSLIRDQQTESKPPTEGRIERLAPWAFVGIGVLMMAVAAADYLATSVATAFVVLGAALVALGGLAARAEGTLKLGVQGVEMFLRARDALVEVQREVEERGDEDEAKRVAVKVEELDDWFADYVRRVEAQPNLSPFVRAALMKQAWQERYPPSPERDSGTGDDR